MTIFVTACQAASKTLLEAIGEIYESQWTGHDLLYIQTQSVDMLWQDFSHKLADQVLLPMNTYQSQFPEMRVCWSFYIYLLTYKFIWKEAYIIVKKSKNCVLN